MSENLSSAELHSRLRLLFAEHFGETGLPVRTARAPGRVNLLGEHTDYNGGLVLPMAIDREVAVRFRRREDRRVRLFAADYGERAEFSLEEIEHTEAGLPAASSSEALAKEEASAALSKAEGAQTGHWSNYPRGVAWALQESGRRLIGIDAVVGGNLPRGAGLSSSAAVEVAFALAFLAAAQYTGKKAAPFDPDEAERVELAKLCQRAENEFVGVRCGLMDQLVSLLAREGAALLIDCTTLFIEPVPLETEKLRVVVADSGVRRELSSSIYNRIREECESAAEKLLGRQGATLREAEKEIPAAELPGKLEALTTAERQRFMHVSTENFRVVNAVAAAFAGDFRAFGNLMIKSHRSLRERFGVSCRELDLLVQIATGVPGVLGSRMTGAGFGGSTVTLTAEWAVEKLRRAVAEKYPREAGREATIRVFSPSGPAAVPAVLDEH